MPAGTEIRLLGPLQVRCGGAVVAIPAAKQRALLVALLLQEGRPVPADRLAELLWAPDPPPPTSAVALRNYVLRLRRALGAAGRQLIQTVPGGYVIELDDCSVDLARFGHELAGARAAAADGDWQQARAHADAALGWWRGEPLSDVDLPAVTAQQVPRLAEMRLQARELRIEADLALARHADAVTELPQLIAANPVRERLYALLMLALYRSGRRAESLDTYRTARDVLAEEVGADPGPELQALHQQILHDDPALTPPSAPGATAGLPGPAAAAAPGTVPRQLPGPVAGFTGRDNEMAALTSLLGTEPGVHAPALVISAIAGMAGVGKTALAVHWAHQVADRFGDGQLYVNLRGYDPHEPVTAADALAGFLRTLGVPGEQIPDDLGEKARLYRSKLAGRRILVVLDNARDGEQVRPLLPGSPGCVALVTSRDTLAGLVATDGARRLDLDVLPLANAVALLRSLTGGRVDEDRDAAAALAELCARLPLALRIAAELAAARPETPLRELAADLTATRLDLLDAGEDRADVRAVFSWSLRQLPGDVAAAFALTGLHPGEDLDAYAVAALSGTPARQARRVLDWLQRASLLQAAGPGRYGMHDLLRAYAREQAAAQHTGHSSDQALTRLFDYYLAAAAAAMDVVFPAEARRRPRVPPSAAVVPEMPGQADGRAWLDQERANLVAAVVHCADHGWHRHAADLAGMLFRDLISGSHLTEALIVYGHALQAARRSGDLAAEAAALSGLGGAHFKAGRFAGADGYYQAALESYRRQGDRAGEARALHNLGFIEYQTHNYRSATSYYHRAMSAYEDTGDGYSVAIARSSLAGVLTELGSYDQAAEHLQLARAVFGEQNDHLREAEALSQMGSLSARHGQPARAAAFHEQALALFRRIGNPGGIAAELANLGEVSLRQGACQQAIGYLQQALALHRQTGYQHGETLTRRALAKALHGAGQLDASRAELEMALRIATETGSTYQRACAHGDLAENFRSGGEDERARQHWQQALDLYTQVGAPEADQIRSRLGNS